MRLKMEVEINIAPNYYPPKIYVYSNELTDEISDAIKILKKYSKSLSSKLDRYKIDCKIEGFEQDQQFFIDSFKKMYNCENLESLNRENVS